MEAETIAKGISEDCEEFPSYSVTLASCEILGLEVPLVEVEVHAGAGLPQVEIVGLAEPSVRESRQRIRAAIAASNIRFPEEKITINLAPASLRKMGTYLDLPMALGILIAAKKIEPASLRDLATTLFVGELSLSGALRPMRGILTVAMMAKERGYRTLILPRENVAEAALVTGIHLIAVRDLGQVLQHVCGEAVIAPYQRPEDDSVPDVPSDTESGGVDLEKIRGQRLAKQALILAAAGGHNLLMIGPPGAGKTLLARSLPALLPDLNEREAVDTTRVHSAAGLLQNFHRLLQRPPFRAPHHSVSDAGLFGGGRHLTPGEISLSHHGVLFLDELPEFRRNVLELLREPLESGKVVMSRANGFVTYPARIQLVTAMNPCPCGFAGVDDCTCHCTAFEVRNYTRRISGPLLDRMDIRLFLRPVSQMEMLGTDADDSPNSQTARDAVKRVREIQRRRFVGLHFQRNAEIPADQLERFCALDPDSRKALQQILSTARASVRAMHRILRLSRTLADLSGEKSITADNLNEAHMFWHLPGL